MEGVSGSVHGFDLLLEKAADKRLVWVKDWNRTVGVNMVIKVDKAVADVGLRNPVIVATKFSDHAKAYANRRGVTLISRRELCDALLRRGM
jgi:HJR/Mrr/RecB family endonuclease